MKSPKFPIRVWKKFKELIVEKVASWMLEKTMRISALVAALLSVSFIKASAGDEWALGKWPIPALPAKYVIILWIVGVEMLALLVYALYLAYRRDSVENERIAERVCRQQDLAKQQNLPGLLTEPEANLVSEIRRVAGQTFGDSVFKKAAFTSGGIVLLICAAVFSLVKETYAFTANVGMKKGYSRTPIMLVVQRKVTDDKMETLATGISDTVGHCAFLRKLEGGAYHIVAYRENDGTVDWSEKDVTISSDNQAIYMPTFPQFRCPKREFGPIYFSKASAEISQDADRIIGPATAELTAVDGLALIEGRTCDLPFYFSETQDNYTLSHDRCKTVGNRMVPGIYAIQLVLAPLEDRHPQEETPKNEQGRQHQRFVRILLLKRLFASEL